MKKILTLFIIILIINLPITIADETKPTITDFPKKCGNNNIDSGEQCDPPFSTSHKYNPEPCIQKLKSEGKTDKDILKTQHYNFITCNDECGCSVEPKPTITPWKPLCGNNVIDQGEECEPPYYLSKIINPQQCKNKYDYSQQKAFCNNDCECEDITSRTQIIESSENTPSCGNYNLEQQELCDPTATNGVGKCEENWKDFLTQQFGLTREEITQRLNEIDHFECSSQCNYCTAIPKSTIQPPPKITKCGNQKIDMDEECDPPNTGKNNPKTVQQCRDFLFYGEEMDTREINDYLSKNNVYCETDLETGDECICMYEEKTAEIDCNDLQKQIQQQINDYFSEEKIQLSCAMKEWIKQSIQQLNQQTKCQLDIDRMFKEINKKCQKIYEEQKISPIGKVWNWIKKGFSYITPKWVKRAINFLSGGGKPCNNGTDVSIFQHGGCNNQGDTCLYEPELSYLHGLHGAVIYYPYYIWHIILNKITGTDLSFYVWGRCDETCNCVKDDDYNNKVNEFIERFKQEIQEQEVLVN